MDGPAQSHTIFKFHDAHVISSVFFSALLSGQSQISFLGVLYRFQFSVLVSFVPPQSFQREDVELLRFRIMNETQGRFRGELPDNFLEALCFDLFPGDVRRNGTGDGERHGFRRILRT